MSMTGAGNPARWSPVEDVYLQREWASKTDRQLGEVLGRSDNAVSNRRQLLGLVEAGGGRCSNRGEAGVESARALWTYPKGYDKSTVAWARENPLDREARAILAHLRDPAAAGARR